MTLPWFVHGTLRPGAYHHDRLLLGRTAIEEEALLPGTPSPPCQARFASGR
ncbi:hypothetical protein [Streptomyces sp. NPDC126503]|uniref:hypothetical protein n=1 Tax=Streptomyces sp. NPDC126503 TaxID=3155315 RepID=UPI0033311F2F